MIPESKKTYKSFVFILAFVLNSCLGSFLVGYKLGELNLLLIDLQHLYEWSESNTTLYTGILNAMLPIGAIFGAIISGNCFEKIGRRWGLIIADILGIVGSLLCIFIGNGAWTQILGRFISGISAGINCQVIPLYVNELTPIEISGFMGSFFQTSLTIGCLTAYVMGLKIPDDSANYDVTDTWWRWVFAFPVLTCGLRLSMLLTCFRFETPFSLMKLREEEKVSDVMKKIYEEEYIDDVIQNIEAKMSSYQDVSYSELFSFYKKRLFLGVILMVIQQLSGVNAVVTESSTLYDYNGDTEQVKILTVINSIILFLAALLSGLTTDRWGRRTTILVGNFSCLVCLFLMGIFMLFSSDIMKEISIGMTYLFLLSFGVSLGPVIWIYEPEILPDKGISLAVVANWFFCGIVVFATPLLIADIGISALYFIFMGILIVGQLYLHFALKETKNKTQSEVDEMFGAEQMKEAEEVVEKNEFQKWD